MNYVLKLTIFDISVYKIQGLCKYTLMNAVKLQTSYLLIKLVK